MDICALYEIKRHTFLNGFIQSPDHYSPGLAYAYEHRMAPIFHEDVMREGYDNVDPFADAYRISAEFCLMVTKYLDERWLAKDLEAVQFYKLEDHFGGYKANRMELIRVLEYTRISGRFDEAVWAAVESNAPAEANSIDHTFEPKDIHFG